MDDDEALFHRRHNVLGDPWNNDVYGYAYGQGSHGFIFMNNMDFKSRKVLLSLDDKMGLARGTEPLRIRSHFPEQTVLSADEESNFQAGQRVEVWLRPFEVALWEITAADPAAGSSRRNIARAEVHSRQLSLERTPGESWMRIDFAEPSPEFQSTVRRPTLSEFKSMGYERPLTAYQSTLPDFAGPQMLALVLKFAQDGKPWRHRQPADLLQLKAMIGEQLIIRFETVPNFRQTENNEWCPWLVFRIRTTPDWSRKNLALAVNAYLPRDVDMRSEAWLVPRWWDTVLDI